MSPTKKFLSIPFIGLILITLISFPLNNSNAQTKIRVGVFDSRAVAVAFYNSKYSTAKQIFEAIGTRIKEAKEKDDKNAIAKIEGEANLRQAIMHEQGFGKGSIKNIMETVKDKTIQLAIKENLSLIISKWEIVNSVPEVILVDITEKIVDLFEPTEKIKEMVKEIMKSEPIKDAYLIQD